MENTKLLSKFIGYIFRSKPNINTQINLGYLKCKLDEDGNRIIELYDKDDNNLGIFPIYKYNKDTYSKYVKDFVKFLT